MAQAACHSNAVSHLTCGIRPPADQLAIAVGPQRSPRDRRPAPAGNARCELLRARRRRSTRTPWIGRSGGRLLPPRPTGARNGAVAGHQVGPRRCRKRLPSSGSSAACSSWFPPRAEEAGTGVQTRADGRFVVCSSVKASVGPSPQSSPMRRGAKATPHTPRPNSSPPRPMLTHGPSAEELLARRGSSRIELENRS